MIDTTFTPIPKWILKSRLLSAAELYVFSYMYDGWNYERRNGNKYQISIRKLQSEIGYNKMTILSAIEKMEKNNILSVTRDKRGDNRDAKNIYEFNTEKVWVEKSKPTPKNKGIENYTNEGIENYTHGRVEKTIPHNKKNNKEELSTKNNSRYSTSTGTETGEKDDIDRIFDSFDPDVKEPVRKYEDKSKHPSDDLPF